MCITVYVYFNNFVYTTESAVLITTHAMKPVVATNVSYRNYRPVSLTSVPCKIMETMIKAELVKHLESSGVMSNSQHGFTRGRSCLTNLLETFEAWTRIVEEGYGTDVIFLDFRKVFDSVSHVKLLQKLRSYGMDEKLVV